MNVIDWSNRHFAAVKKEKKSPVSENIGKTILCLSITQSKDNIFYERFQVADSKRFKFS